MVDWKRSPLYALLVALFLICVIFPDVLFQGASLRITDQLAGAEQHLPVYSRYGSLTKPFIKANDYLVSHSPLIVQQIEDNIAKFYKKFFYTHHWWDSYTDYGGSLYQSDPMIEFMRYCIWNFNSPYWNPYSAAGQFGPETLVDQKFSVFTVLTAIFGGSSLAYNAVLLFFYFLGTYFVYRTAQMCLRFSPLAGVAMGVFYLLNGYILANTSSNVALNYLVVPMCIYASCLFLETRSILRFIAVLFSFAALLTFTFMPTTIASTIGIYGVLLGYLFVLKKRGVFTANSQIALNLSIHLGVVVLAILLLSFLYLPIFESFQSNGILTMYSKRIFFPAHWHAILSLFSSSHFFESYGAMEAGVWPFIGNVVFHFGIVAFCLMSCSIGKWEQEETPLVITCLGLTLLVLCRIFGVPGVSFLFSVLPIIGNLGCQYWWAALVFPMLILVGIGVNNLESGNSRNLPTLVILGIFGIAWIVVLSTYGFHHPHLGHKIVTNILLILLASLTGALIFKANQTKNMQHRKKATLVVVVLMFGELLAEGHVLHYQSNDIFTNPPSEIGYIKANIGPYRTMTIGNLFGVLHGTRPELGSGYQINEITSMNEGDIQNYIHYFHKIFTFGGRSPIDPMFPSLLYFEDKPEQNKIDWNEVNLLGVKYIILPSYFKNYQKAFTKQGLHLVFENASSVLFENPYALPRAFGIALPKKPEGKKIDLPLKGDATLSKTKITQYKNTEVQLEGYAEKPMLVVLTDNWQKNWKATVNGNLAPILLFNETFRGVWISSPGKYIINMSYRPSTLTVAFLLTLGILLFVFLLLGKEIRKKLHQ
ncbi:hypothetical protein Lgra_0961 [Legionella gratiana]|uniref:Bacterial membrane protein YfhO n=1 Tax=Legionella gratiana TaxID=45066 RepID=A0A378J0V1_9GAMM|nr:hypothetical protein [Legionella gratiana]KTD12953.1 hypothetical protein Lgra_0961 [Legionella gratiana]STX41225.1 Uncharacterised protein [Legionella gratiana]